MADIVEDSEPGFVPVMVAPYEDRKPGDATITIEFGDGGGAAKITEGAALNANALDGFLERGSATKT